MDKEAREQIEAIIGLAYCQDTKAPDFGQTGFVEFYTNQLLQNLKQLGYRQIDLSKLTVLSDEQIEAWCEQFVAPVSIVLHDKLKEFAGEQAEISFEAGKQEGKREVVEWIKQNAGLGAKTIEELNTGYSFIPIRSDKWQAILKK